MFFLAIPESYNFIDFITYAEIPLNNKNQVAEYLQTCLCTIVAFTIEACQSLLHNAISR